jgi:hypothetical protein
MSEQELFDLTSNFLRTGLATVQGAQMPWPYGGKQRQVMIDIDLPRLYALGLSPNDVSNAVQAQNLVLPLGHREDRRQELLFRLNSSPIAVRDLASLPDQERQRRERHDRRRRQVRDGFAPQTSLVRANGRRGVLMTLLKSAGASTLDIVKRVRGVMPSVLATLPPEYKMDLLFDQSLYVRAAVEGVVKEAGIAAGLTALMILLFLGSWRSTLIVVTSIPLSILVSLIVLACIGETPQPHDPRGPVARRRDPRRRRHRRDRERAPQHGDEEADRAGHPRRGTADRGAGVRGDALHLHRLHPGGVHLGSRAIALHAARDGGRVRDDDVVLPVAHARAHDGALPARARGRPLRGRSERDARPKRDIVWRVHERFNVHFERLRHLYGGYLDWALDHKRLVTVGFGAFVVLSLVALFPNLGRDFFPSVDAGQIRFHVRTNSGTRIETTEQLFERVEDEIRRHPQGRDRDGHRQHRHADQRPEPRAGGPVDDLVGRRRGPHPAEREASSHGHATSRSCAGALRSTFRRPSSSSSRRTSRRRCSTSD